MKNILVYPCGTEIGLEIFRALNNSIHYNLVGGSSSYDHGRFVYKNHIDHLPFLTDYSSEQEVIDFNKKIKKYHIDMIYPAMDGMVTLFSKYKNCLSPIVIAADYKTTKITRSKKLTYSLFSKILPIPRVYTDEEITENNIEYPLFLKPDIGQGSVGTQKVTSYEELKEFRKNHDNQLILEYLPGKEYTVDCFTNSEGKLLYCQGRDRKRIKNGISVNSFFVKKPEFKTYAEIINSTIRQKGGWFFQVKEAYDGTLKLLEISSRIAGTSALTRNIGVNLPLLSANIFNDIPCDDIIINNYNIELDRALGNVFKLDIHYDVVYIDYDDTIINHNNEINTNVIKFLYQCINSQKKIILLTKHDGNLESDLKKYRIENLFDEIIHIEKKDKKTNYIKYKNSIFIDDSYGERREVKNTFGIDVFDVNNIECLLEE